MVSGKTLVIAALVLASGSADEALAWGQEKSTS